MSNVLIITGTINFMNKEIPNVSGGFEKDKKGITDKTIAEIHNMRTTDVRRRITDNIKRFKENIDFIDLKKYTQKINTPELLDCLGYSKQSTAQAQHIYLLSDRGYSKLIKIMNTDLAWNIHDKLADNYFSLQEPKEINLIDYYNMPLDKNAYAGILVKELYVAGEYESETAIFSKVYKIMLDDYKVDVNEHKILFNLQFPFENNISMWKVVKRNPALYNLFMTVLTELVKSSNSYQLQGKE